MKKINYFAVLMLLTLVVSACGNKVQQKDTKKKTVKTETKASSKEAKYVTEADVIDKEERVQDGEDYVFYTFKGGKQFGLPKGMTIEEAKIDLDEIPEPGSQYTEERK